MDLVQPFIKLICEGKATEPHYFVGYLHSRGFRLPNMVYQPKDHSPMGISREALAQYKEARKLKIPPNNILIAAIFDRDLHPGVSNAIEMLRESQLLQPSQIFALSTGYYCISKQLPDLLETVMK